jgi:hypothetical protein
VGCQRQKADAKSLTFVWSAGCREGKPSYNSSNQTPKPVNEEP